MLIAEIAEEKRREARGKRMPIYASSHNQNKKMMLEAEYYQKQLLVLLLTTELDSVQVAAKENCYLDSRCVL